MALTPEQQGTACDFYDSKEALRYTTCTQTLQLQRELTQAAIQLLHLPVSVPIHDLFSASCNSMFEVFFVSVTGCFPMPPGPWLWIRDEWGSTVRKRPHLGWL